MIIPLSSNNLKYIVSFLKNGEIIGFPTETVYGLIADATNGDAISKIFLVKDRPYVNPLTIHVSDDKMAEKYAIIDPISRMLIKKFWPGPLTIIFPIREKSNIHSLVIGNKKTIAIRRPNGFLNKILKVFNKPVVAPSANISGKISATTALDVFEDFGNKVPIIFDNNSSEIGIESTIVKISQKKIFLLRSGAISRKEIEEVTNQPLTNYNFNLNNFYFQKKSFNCSLRTRIRLNVKKVYSNEVLLGFGIKRARNYETAMKILNLSITGNLKEAAKNFFNYLRILDKFKANFIAVEPIPKEGIGEAINDRLIRASKNN